VILSARVSLHVQVQGRNRTRYPRQTLNRTGRIVDPLPPRIATAPGKAATDPG
jgi:hypothetical protein